MFIITGSTVKLVPLAAIFVADFMKVCCLVRCWNATYVHPQYCDLVSAHIFFERSKVDKRTKNTSKVLRLMLQFLHHVAIKCPDISEEHLTTTLCKIQKEACNFLWYFNLDTTWSFAFYWTVFVHWTAFVRILFWITYRILCYEERRWCVWYNSMTSCVWFDLCLAAACMDLTPCVCTNRYGMYTVHSLKHVVMT